MKVVLLANAKSIHTIQWVLYMKKAGIDISVISQDDRDVGFPKDVPLYLSPYKGNVGYFLNIFFVKKIISEIKPDLVHAHYASGYGTTARLVNFHPYILSVWGSDVYDFPYKSKIHHWLLQKNLYAADALSSTSQCMMEQTLRVARNLQPFSVVPFGVNLQKFNRQEGVKSPNEIVIGTVKTLSEKYGIDFLIKSVAILKENLINTQPEIAEKLRLRIVGGGELEGELKQMAQQLKIGDITTFVGKVTHENVPDELNKLDIYVALSREESFGVAVIEAEAVRLPVVVTDVGGLPEVVQHQKTGFIVPKENPEKAAEMLEILIKDPELRAIMGYNGQQFVHKYFSWESCVQKMIHLYKQVLKEKG